jgi:hypothetical protein
MEHPIMHTRFVSGFVTLAGALALQTAAHANEHLMQIEQIITSVNGDTSAQAIQLRMRANGQNVVSGGKLVVFDATGSNPIVIADSESNVPIGVTGARILFASASFPAQTSPPAVPDFFFTDVIPASYFAAGSLVWEDDAGATIWWRLSWGGAAYTGPNTGSTFNDVDGNFGPPFASALPTCGAYAVLFKNGATAKSVTNAADYRFTTEQNETFFNNAGTGFVVTGALPSVRIQTIDASASEQPNTDTGRFRVTRTTTCTQVPLSVLYAMSGTATNGSDYQMLRGTVSIPAAATQATITVRPINDALPEADETATATLSPNAAYTIGAPSTGTVTIHSNE